LTPIALNRSFILDHRSQKNYFHRKIHAPCSRKLFFNLFTLPPTLFLSISPSHSLAAAAHFSLGHEMFSVLKIFTAAAHTQQSANEVTDKNVEGNIKIKGLHRLLF
jgi:hypothetical protein